MRSAQLLPDTIYAPDLRGYGESQTLSVDAMRGVRDDADDLAAPVHQLGLPAIRLPGWSLGGNIAVQCTLDHLGEVRALALQATDSPFGFGRTGDVEGTPTWPDSAGSGGSMVSSEFAGRIARGDRGNERFSPRAVMSACYFKPPFRVSPEREELLSPRF